MSSSSYQQNNDSSINNSNNNNNNNSNTFFSLENPDMLALDGIFDQFLFSSDRNTDFLMSSNYNSNDKSSSNNNGNNNSNNNSNNSNSNNNSNTSSYNNYNNNGHNFNLNSNSIGNYSGGMYSGSDGSDDDDDDENGRKKSRGVYHNMTEQQKIERRERNREHAKRSRVRKKFLLDSLQQSVHALQDENEKLKSAIRKHLSNDAEALLSNSQLTQSSVIASNPNDATKTLDDPDYSLVKALQTAQQNFVISDPTLPDNPIVYASSGFLNLTGYTLEQVLGRNCRFLQGPATDPKAVDRIRKGIERGEDTTVVILNYRYDGSTFWNQFFVAALRDGSGNIVNYLGVQCKVSENYASAFEDTHEDIKGK